MRVAYEDALPHSRLHERGELLLPWKMPCEHSTQSRHKTTLQLTGASSMTSKFTKDITAEYMPLTFRQMHSTWGSSIPSTMAKKIIPVIL